MAESFPKSLDGWAAYLARQPIPVMRHTAEHIERLREQLDDIDARIVADRVGSDPLMVLRTFAQIAERRGNRRAADVATLDRAIVMLGLAPFLDIARDAPVVESSPSAERGAYRGFLRVLRRAQMARIYATRIAAWRNDVAAEEIGLAALLHDSAELLVWCFAPELADRIRHMLADDPKLRSATAQRADSSSSWRRVTAIDTTGPPRPPSSDWSHRWPSKKNAVSAPCPASTCRSNSLKQALVSEPSNQR